MFTNKLRLRTLVKNSTPGLYSCIVYRDFNEDSSEERSTDVALSSSFLLGNSNWCNVIKETQKDFGCIPFVEKMKRLFKEDIDIVRLKGGRSKYLREIIENIIFNNYEKIEIWGLIVLLVSKATNHLTVTNNNNEESTSIMQSQQELATISQMILTSQLLHGCMVNIERGALLKKENLVVRNEMALLSGDYLLSKSLHKIALLRNLDVWLQFSKAVRDLSQVAFIQQRNKLSDFISHPSAVNCIDSAIREWTLMHVLSDAGYLGKACQCALLASKNDYKVQKQGYQFGKHFALAWQAYVDLVPFIGKNHGMSSCNLFPAPLLFHIAHDPSICKPTGKELSTVKDVEFSEIFEAVLSGPGIQLTKQLHKEHSQRASTFLSLFPENEATTVLSNIIAAMEDAEGM